MTETLRVARPNDSGSAAGAFCQSAGTGGLGSSVYSFVVEVGIFLDEHIPQDLPGTIETMRSNKICPGRGIAIPSDEPLDKFVQFVFGVRSSSRIRIVVQPRRFRWIGRTSFLWTLCLFLLHVSGGT